MTSIGIDAENFSGSVVGSRDVENTRKKILFNNGYYDSQTEIYSILRFRFLEHSFLPIPLL